MSFAETLVILLVAVIVLGPRRLPEAARRLGHWMGVARRAGDEFKRQILSMDQALDDRLNTAVSDLDALVPSDEALAAKLEAAVAEAEAAFGAPPPASPDDAWDAPPVPGGLPAEPEPPPGPEAAAGPEPAPSSPGAPGPKPDPAAAEARP